MMKHFIDNAIMQALKDIWRYEMQNTGVKTNKPAKHPPKSHMWPPFWHIWSFSAPVSKFVHFNLGLRCVCVTLTDPPCPPQVCAGVQAGDRRPLLPPAVWQLWGLQVCETGRPLQRHAVWRDAARLQQQEPGSQLGPDIPNDLQVISGHVCVCGRGVVCVSVWVCACARRKNDQMLIRCEFILAFACSHTSMCTHSYTMHMHTYIDTHKHLRTHAHT